MQIGGLQKTTLIDYPGKIACTVFIIGCNFRCPFCYSGELVLPEKTKNCPILPEDKFFDFLKERKGLLEGVVLCGGEPTLYKDLPNFIKRIKELGYPAKLDTNGSNPEMLKKLIEERLINYAAMDIKSSKEKYEAYSGIKMDLSIIEKSVDILKQGRIDYEFRTTLAPGIDKEDIKKIAEWIGPAKKYFLQEFNNKKEIIEPGIISLPILQEEEIKGLIKRIKSKFEICQLR